VGLEAAIEGAEDGAEEAKKEDGVRMAFTFI
jgi:hypothetical protein